MVEFAYPWALVLLGLPAVVYFFTAEYKEQKASIQVPYFQRLLAVTGKEPSTGAVLLNRRLMQRILLVIGWIAGISRGQKGKVFFRVQIFPKDPALGSGTLSSRGRYCVN